MRGIRAIYLLRVFSNRKVQERRGKTTRNLRSKMAACLPFALAALRSVVVRPCLVVQVLLVHTAGLLQVVVAALVLQQPVCSVCAKGGEGGRTSRGVP